MITAAWNLLAVVESYPCDQEVFYYGTQKLVTEANFYVVEIYTTLTFLELVCFWFLCENYLL
jgi:hypothetical protein